MLDVRLGGQLRPIEPRRDRRHRRAPRHRRDRRRSANGLYIAERERLAVRPRSRLADPTCEAREFERMVDPHNRFGGRGRARERRAREPLHPPTAARATSRRGRRRRRARRASKIFSRRASPSARTSPTSCCSSSRSRAAAGGRCTSDVSLRSTRRPTSRRSRRVPRRADPHAEPAGLNVDVIVGWRSPRYNAPMVRALVVVSPASCSLIGVHVPSTRTARSSSLLRMRGVHAANARRRHRAHALCRREHLCSRSGHRSRPGASSIERSRLTLSPRSRRPSSGRSKAFCALRILRSLSGCQRLKHAGDMRMRAITVLGEKASRCATNGTQKSVQTSRPGHRTAAPRTSRRRRRLIAVAHAPLVVETIRDALDERRQSGSPAVPAAITVASRVAAPAR